MKQSFFEGFYAHYILHDVYGKIVPGTIIMMSIAVGNDPSLENFITLISGEYSIAWVFWIGLAWLIGFSLQAWRNNSAVLRSTFLEKNQKYKN